jgi:hypothetical protein
MSMLCTVQEEWNENILEEDKEGDLLEIETLEWGTQRVCLYFLLTVRRWKQTSERRQVKVQKCDLIGDVSNIHARLYIL